MKFFIIIRNFSISFIKIDLSLLVNLYEMGSFHDLFISKFFSSTYYNLQHDSEPLIPGLWNSKERSLDGHLKFNCKLWPEYSISPLIDNMAVLLIWMLFMNKMVFNFILWIKNLKVSHKKDEHKNPLIELFIMILSSISS